jgi:hypothetical protein
MNGTDIAELEDRLWSATDELRANSKLRASEYFTPVLVDQSVNSHLVAFPIGYPVMSLSRVVASAGSGVRHMINPASNLVKVTISTASG